MQLNQNQSYDLEFPVELATGEPVPAVDAATFTLIRSGREIQKVNLCNGGSFTPGLFTAPLEANPSYKNVYQFEVWLLIDGKPCMPHSGEIEFKETFERIEAC
ncbi:hypothetical protein [Arsukibacterium sp.]|uniref:hypothetical protein n=1 Tax=Arsukibacterium sp. TaxID=1977258 RepID=UPI00299EF138|nr:hypothetical protein [Arsukibacterium sp.]MDX1538812.1 hypothetical protein [Arsukibacterium sp.]